ncbi:MAG: (deoxy)nucleoside triphosphate pyrophosphohydrolase [Verrucomicrobiales bacterium]|nr:(deoxy)nucleoside triphosphate pyrophosphohydrolase [Verrucomicrobiales bacterium]
MPPRAPSDSSGSAAETPNPAVAEARGPWVEVAAGLVFREGRLLVTQRSAGTHLAGLWEFPGGKREPGETWEACLRRELLEELGVEVEVGELFDEVRHSYPTKSVYLRFYRCVLRSGEPRPVGCAAVAWTDRTGLRGFAFPEADERLLHRLGEGSSVWAP